MTFSLNAKLRLIFFMWLVALHSFAVFLGLLLLPAQQLSLFGLENYRASFFQAQGGVFHLVMSVAYIMAAKYIDETPALIYFSISAKSIAVVFLLIYYVTVESAWIISLSAIGDGIMAAIIYLLYIQYKREVH